MKTIELAGDGVSVDDLVREAGEEGVVLRTADGRRFLLVEVDAFDDEVARTRRNQAVMAFLDARAAEPAEFELDEARRRLGLDDE